MNVARVCFAKDEDKLISKIMNAMRKRFFVPLIGAVVLGLSAYVGYRTYDTYNEVSENNLLLMNVEALASDAESGVEIESCLSIAGPCKLSSGASGIGPVFSASW